jgi:hypothetical protein
LDGRTSALSAEGDQGLMMLEDGGGLNLHLPPPKMLPDQSAAEALMLAETAAATPTVHTKIGLLTPKTQKDLPTSRLGSSTSGEFWGGVGMAAGGMGGITPVHTTLVPAMSVVLRRALMENINPSLNRAQQPQSGNNTNVGGFASDGFADVHPFTLKTLDAYRMHLWGKMATQQSYHHHHQLPSPSSSRTSPSPPASPSSGLGYMYHGYGGHGALAERLRPLFFSTASLGMFGKHAVGVSYAAWVA